MQVATPFTAFQLVRYTIFFWMALRRTVQETLSSKFEQWINQYDICGLKHPIVPISEIWEFSEKVAREILKDDSMRLVSELDARDLQDYVSVFLSKGDRNLPEWQVVSLLKLRYLEWSELICRYQKTSIDFGDECPNDAGVIHFIREIKQLCLESSWNEIVNQAILIHLHEAFAAASVSSDKKSASSIVFASVYGDAVCIIKRFGLV